MENNLRPTFLTVLCVLTFIGSAFGIYNAITSYTSAEMAVGVTKDAMEAQQDKIEEQVGDDEEASDMIASIMGNVTEGLTPENVRSNAIGSGIASVLTLLGAILMWGLNKKGYWIYVIGAIVAVVTPLFVYEGFMGIAGSGGAAFTGILFCVLYGLNLKHMHD